MRIVKTLHDVLGYVWVCPVCFYATKITTSTPLASINLSVFDYALSMWIRNATPKLSGRMSCNKSGVGYYMALFRKSYKHYYKKYVAPYLILPGIVEIDETKISR